MITLKPVSNFRSDDHKAVLARIVDDTASLKAKKAKRDSIKKSIENNESSAPNLTSRLSDLLARRSTKPATPLDVQLHEVLCEIRDDEDDLSFLEGKAKLFEIEAEKRMLDDARPQIVAAEKEIFDTFSKLYNQFLPYWQTKRALHGNSIRTYELFANSFDNFLDVPVNINSVWCELFREGIAAGHVSKMPQALRVG